MSIKNEEISLNTILCGPPGTGKTFNAKIRAVQICMGWDDQTIAEKDILHEYNNLIKDGRIQFITFHQSYSYEDFIEGIKPVIENDTENENETGNDNSNIHYKIENGIFKNLCKTAEFDRCEEKWLKTYENGDEIKILKNGDIHIWRTAMSSWNENKESYKKFVENCFKNSEANITTHCGDKVIEVFKKEPKRGDIILSCSYVMQNSEIFANKIGIVLNDDIDGSEPYIENPKHTTLKRKVKWLSKINDEKIFNLKLSDDKNRENVKNGATFFQINKDSKSKDFKSIITEIEDKMKVHNYEIKESIKPYVLIIDEINRGNISKIFGELITLMEDSKRMWNKEGMTTILPYSKEYFSIPNNLYILGTMNTADRSISLMDTALRRRFNFEEMMPDYNLLKDIMIKDKDGNDFKINIEALLRTINDRLEFLLDRDHTIGHAYFVPLIDRPTINQLSSIFKNKIIPLLQEYFYDDYSKILLVLGDNAKNDGDYQFIKIESKNNIFFKNSVGTNDEEIPNAKIFKINDKAFDKPESYIQIYSHSEKQSADGN
ncbi:McrB family protein [Mycoplasmopsis primatum]|uniref:McrB family protein n=1 Tax=Mycoplasmopsis primatum TaxID=55604 RepID=UPI00069005C8|nr:AAA family ATPase [Mycoplasmopsis primatum]